MGNKVVGGITNNIGVLSFARSLTYKVDLFGIISKKGDKSGEPSSLMWVKTK